MQSYRDIHENKTGNASDKWDLYLDAYHNELHVFQDKKINILEIGVQNGGSLEVWSKYFPKAKRIIGCDINEDCRKLSYSDKRIEVLIGDATNNDFCEKNFASLSLDVIIDDGAHTSESVIKAFCLFFDRLNYGGKYIIEDLHCSYWQNYQGGLKYPYSSMSFLKKLADIVNHEHWNNNQDSNALLTDYFKKYKVFIPEKQLVEIASVKFINSMCIIEKRTSKINEIGKRNVTGTIAKVADTIFNYRGSNIIKKNQVENPWSNFIENPEIEYFSLKKEKIDDHKRIDILNKQIEELEERTIAKQKKISSLQKQYKILKQEHLAIGEKFEKNKLQNTQLIHNLNSAYKQIEELEERTSTKREKISVLESRTQILKHQQQKLTLELDENIKQNKHLLNELQDAKAHIDSLKHELTSKQQAMLQAQNHENEQNETINKLNNTIQQNLLELNEKTKTIQKYEEQYMELKQKLQNNEQQIQAERNRLQQELKHTNNTLNRLMANERTKLVRQYHRRLPLRLAGNLWRFIKNPLQYYRMRRDTLVVRRSGLFDDAWYLQQYPDLYLTTVDMLQHYMLYGASEDRNPNKYFSTKFYKNKYSDVRKAGINPFLHYLEYGKKERREINMVESSDYISSSKYNMINSLDSCFNIEEGLTIQRLYKKENLGDKKIAVLVNLYDLDYLDNILFYLSNIRYDYHLILNFIGIKNDAFVQCLTQDYTNSTFHFIKNEEVGFNDFIKHVKSINVSKYDFLLFLTSAKKTKKNIIEINERNYYEGLLGSPLVVNKYLNNFLNDPKIGIAGISEESKGSSIIDPKNKRIEKLFSRNSFWINDKVLSQFKINDKIHTEIKKVFGINNKIKLNKAYQLLFNTITATYDLCILKNEIGFFQQLNMNSKAELFFWDYVHYLSKRPCSIIDPHEKYKYQPSVIWNEKQYILLPPSLERRIETNYKIYNNITRDRKIKKKLAIVTAISNSYDEYYGHEYVDINADYFLYTDIKTRVPSYVNVRLLERFRENGILSTRYIKTNLHKLLSEYEIVLWHDANIGILGPIDNIIKDFELSDLSLCFINHPFRNNVKDEIEACIQNNKDVDTNLIKQYEEYIEKGFIDNSLYETGLFIIKTNEIGAQTVMDKWWDEILTHSKRDQVSLPFVLWETKTIVKNMFGEKWSIRSDPRMFLLASHNFFSLNPNIRIKINDRKLENPSIVMLNEKSNRNVVQSNRYPKKIDIIICIYNALNDVKKCLASIITSRNEVKYNIIIVNDCSEFKTTNYLNHFSTKQNNCTLITNRKREGYTKTANIGLKRSVNDFVILLNSDTIVSDFWIDRLVNTAYSSCKIGVVGPLSNAASFQSIPDIKSKNNQTAINVLPPKYDIARMNEFCERFSKNNKIAYITLAHGFCLCIKRDVINRIGYFDEKSFPRGYGEENDYCFRVQNAGFKLAVSTDVFIFHSKSKSYPSDERISLMKKGSEQLKLSYGTHKIKHAIKDIEYNPRLLRMRNLSKCLYGSRKKIGVIVPNISKDKAKAPGSSYIRVLNRVFHFEHELIEYNLVSFSEFKNEIHKFDAVLIQRTALNYSEVRWFLDNRNDCSLIFEWDDNLLSVPKTIDISNQYQEKQEAIELLLRNADLITVSTTLLYNASKYFNNSVFIVPNLIDETIWFQRDTKHHFSKKYAETNRSELNILYMGTYTHSDDLQIILPVIEKLKNENKLIKLYVIGGIREKSDLYTTIEIPHDKSNYLEFIPWFKQIANYMDFGVAPLEDNEFNKYKSGLKYLDYSAAGLAGIYSDVPSFRNIVKNEITGIIARNKFDSWYDAINRMINDEQLRYSLAKNSYADIKKNHLLGSSILDYDDQILSAIIAK